MRAETEINPLLNLEMTSLKDRLLLLACFRPCCSKCLVYITRIILAESNVRHAWCIESNDIGINVLILLCTQAHISFMSIGDCIWIILSLIVCTKEGTTRESSPNMVLYCTNFLDSDPLDGRSVIFWTSRIRIRCYLYGSWSFHIPATLFRKTYFDV